MQRDELLQGAERPLLKERWAGVLDVVGVIPWQQPSNPPVMAAASPAAAWSVRLI